MFLSFLQLSCSRLFHQYYHHENNVNQLFIIVYSNNKFRIKP